MSVASAFLAGFADVAAEADAAGFPVFGFSAGPADADGFYGKSIYEIERGRMQALEAGADAGAEDGAEAFS